ncbi:hypothetical protein DFJ73DRAFT_582910 [Zopfochytrium polystomum]|nr:hypothetical protein DFJ73DRAFT_582910 [Zopfochytrium polystomum]
MMEGQPLAECNSAIESMKLKGGRRKLSLPHGTPNCTNQTSDEQFTFLLPAGGGFPTFLSAAGIFSALGMTVMWSTQIISVVLYTARKMPDASMGTILSAIGTGVALLVVLLTCRTTIDSVRRLVRTIVLLLSPRHSSPPPSTPAASGPGRIEGSRHNRF